MHKIERWFCPFCADQLSGLPGSLYCQHGEISFSKSITEMFVEGRENRKLQEAFTHGSESEWFCPSCSHNLVLAELVNNWGQSKINIGLALGLRKVKRDDKYSCNANAIISKLSKNIKHDEHSNN